VNFIGVGIEGSIYAIMDSSKVVQLVDGKWNSISYTGKFKRLAVAQDGSPWLVTSSGDIYG